MRTGPLLLRLTRAVPWVVLLAYQVWQFAGNPAMGGVVAVAWIAVVVLVFAAIRLRVGRIATRNGRVLADLGLLAASYLFASIAGVAIIPPIVAFLALDLSDPGSPGVVRRAALAIGVFGALALLPGFLFAVIVWPGIAVALMAALTEVVRLRPTGAAPLRAPDALGR